MNIEEQILAAKNKHEQSKSQAPKKHIRISYDKKIPTFDEIAELSEKPNKKITLHIRAKVGDEQSKSIIKIPLHKLTKAPSSKREVIERFATEFFMHDEMSIRDNYMDELKACCDYAVLHNVLSAQKFDVKRAKFQHTDGNMIYNSAKEIHALCDWIGEIESSKFSELALRADEAQDIQQAIARLESVLQMLGYGSDSFNTKKYQDDETIQFINNKYGIFNKRTISEKELEVRFNNCAPSLIDQLPTSATTSTVSRVRVAHEHAMGRTVKAPKPREGGSRKDSTKSES